MKLRARMGVRRPEPNHKGVLGRHDEYTWFFRSRLADCCAILSFDRLHLRRPQVRQDHALAATGAL